MWRQCVASCVTLEIVAICAMRALCGPCEMRGRVPKEGLSLEYQSTFLFVLYMYSFLKSLIGVDFLYCLLYLHDWVTMTLLLTLDDSVLQSNAHANAVDIRFATQQLSYSVHVHVYP